VGHRTAKILEAFDWRTGSSVVQIESGTSAGDCDGIAIGAEGHKPTHESRNVRDASRITLSRP
jgi:hypothetical protein